jgi:predicted dinucleotide-binding enzyme
MKNIGYNNSVAIIGANSFWGSQIAMAISNAYRLLLMDSDVEQVSLLANKIKNQIQLPNNIYILACSKDASWEADIIVLASPAVTHPAIAKKIAEVTTCKTILQIVNTSDDALSIKNIVPHSHVIKVTINHSNAIVEGENAEAIELAMQLLSFTSWHIIQQTN